MIGFIRGILIDKEPTRAVLENNGIGYELMIPVSTFVQLPEPGEIVVLHSHLHVREDAMILVGFFTRGEKDLFQLLLTVSGIGLRSALGILSGSKVPEVLASIAGGNEAALTRIPGLGKKTAQRLILDLKEKAAARLRQIGEPSQPAARLDSDIAEQAIQAMVSLGYAKAEAARAVERAAARLGEKPDIEELLRTALQL